MMKGHDMGWFCFVPLKIRHFVLTAVFGLDFLLRSTYSASYVCVWFRSHKIDFD